MERAQRLVAALIHDELVPEALGVGEAQRPVAGPRRRRLERVEALRPELQRRRGAGAPDHAMHHPGAGPPRDRPRVLEEGDVGACVAALVGVEQVVDGRVVLIDRLGDQPEPEHARVEVEVADRVAGDRGDVVDALQLHCALLQQSSSRRVLTAPG
jgi:hypothetical protein